MAVLKWPKPDEDASLPSERFHIRVRGVQKTFGPHHVLRGIDLDVERGKINVIIGGSGQGKSVIMKHRFFRRDEVRPCPWPIFDDSSPVS